MSNEQIKRIREHVFAKYIDGVHVPEIDERGALAALEAHHRAVPVTEDGETYYLGILYFELAYANPTEEKLYLARAKTILEEYRKRSEEEWDAVDDRIDDASGSLDDVPAEERARLLAQAASEMNLGKKPVEEPKGPVLQDGMVLVPAGHFLAGSGKTQRETKSYWIDLHPVTNAEYLRFVESTGYRVPKFWPEGRFRDPEAPVVGISWYDAFKYAAFVGKSLPTKDQWEKAARGRQGRVYPWGDTFDPANACYGRDEGTDAIDKVGKHPGSASEYGAQDMAGLVWEWTDSPDPSDSEQKVICGGSWVDPPELLRCDEHLAAYPKDKYDNIGFRCVRAVKD